MNEWFLCTIKYDKVNEAGKSVSVKEAYLVDALSFTEAEARIIEEVKPFISGEFSVASVKRARMAEIFTGTCTEDDRWYRCKVQYITVDEANGMEKRTAVTILVQAGSIRGALDNLTAGMRDYMGDYVVTAVSETNIMDIYPYKAE